jgi:hypothetical protein
MKVVERLFLNGITGQGGNQAINQRHQSSVAVLARTTPTETTRNERAPALAGIAADFAARGFLQERLTHENTLDFS